jgi:pyruvate/2-oxoglutarate dehydrogenase complex dihydrolipoamide dehydrogenase (E3) component
VEGIPPALIVHLKGKSGPTTITADRILVATGRTPNVDGLGLEAAGVEFGNRGVKVDRRHGTTNPRVFAAGDICSALKFTHAAYAQAEYACLNALLPFRLNVRDRAMSWVTFTDPEVAHAGVGWDELRKMTDSLDTYTQPINLNDRAQMESEARGFARIHCRTGSDKVVAATVVCRHAGEVVAGLSLAVTNGLRLRHVQKTILAYPTRSELVRKIADEWKFSTLTPFRRRLVGLWLLWSRLWG